MVEMVVVPHQLPEAFTIAVALVFTIDLLVLPLRSLLRTVTTGAEAETSLAEIPTVFVLMKFDWMMAVAGPLTSIPVALFVMVMPWIDALVPVPATFTPVPNMLMLLAAVATPDVRTVPCPTLMPMLEPLMPVSVLPER